ncbi:hypothetical protein D5S17_12040 [Pseudonocardiaceae bacterium YIM PH 21723]|nr:hypothetical protein D5S17_12040 [Pseudonocardiaceae bacterium YIM PH 21723]
MSSHLALAAQAASGESPFSLMTLFAVGVLVPVYLPLMFFACRDIWRCDDLTDKAERLWLAAVILLPFAGALTWYSFKPDGPHRPQASYEPTAEELARAIQFRDAA